MPLKINLKKNQKIIINGAVVENNNPRAISFTLLNSTAILRDTEILTAEEADTPASRIYYALQCMYILPESEIEHKKNFEAFLSDFEHAAPSSSDIIAEIREEVENGKLYKALRKVRKLIEHEGKVLNHGQNSTDDELPAGSSGRESTPD
jgi:flagellar protein FlbT